MPFLLKLQRPAQVLVRCAGRKHRVRLAKGRFWARARCPACGTTVDRTRLGRASRWIARTFLPAAPRGLPLWLWLAAMSYVTLALVSAVCVWFLADRWWPATVLLFGPRWVLILPFFVLLPVFLRRDRLLLVPITIAALVVLGPVIGLRTGWRRLFVSPDPARDIRVMSFNTEGGRGLAWSPTGILDGLEVDIAALQECESDVAEYIVGLKGWYTDGHGGACLMSRFPILEVTQMDRAPFRAAGGSGLVVTYRIDVRGRVIELTNLHLLTPRDGLEAIRAGRIDKGGLLLDSKSALRSVEHRFARRWVDTLQGPRLVLGDFNSPVESPMFRSSWGDWQNAFSRVGVGLGGTRLDGWIRVRIDHILADDAWVVVRSWLGPTLGSDHAPILADLRLR